eukprot:5026055-Alexandrium_andersonii.AAC.1
MCIRDRRATAQQAVCSNSEQRPSVSRSFLLVILRGATARPDPPTSASGARRRRLLGGGPGGSPPPGRTSRKLLENARNLFEIA